MLVTVRSVSVRTVLATAMPTAARAAESQRTMRRAEPSWELWWDLELRRGLTYRSLTVAARKNAGWQAGAGKRPGRPGGRPQAGAPAPQRRGLVHIAGVSGDAVHAQGGGDG